jgi:probable HAF family extracellular repeat protein
MVGLGTLAGYTLSAATAVSADGSVVVGSCTDSNFNEEVFRWTASSGMVGLGTPGADSTAKAVSADGSVVVGSNSQGAFIWDPAHGMRSLSQVLTSDYGLGTALQGWQLTSANAISPDGRFIAGAGIESGNQEAWLARLDLPHLSDTSVLEFRPTGTVVGTLSTPIGSGHTFTYALVGGAGSTDNASFTISGNQLLTADAFDFGPKSSYSIRIRSTDETGKTLEQAFTITILDDPALTLKNRTLTVAGTPGNDSFSFAPGAVQHSMTLNGTRLAVDVASVDTVVFVGDGGSDTASLVGTGTAETATLAPNSGQLQGSGYTARASGVSVLSIQGGTSEVAHFSDSPGNDTFTASPTSATLSGSGFVEQANGFGAVIAVSSAGGNDTAYFHDAPGNDTFTAMPGNSYLSGSGFWEQALGFEAVVAGSSGGSDRATLYGEDSASFLGTPTNSQLSGPGLWEQATGFAVVIASGVGKEQATLYGSAGADTFVGTPSYAYLTASNYWEQASSFAVVFAVGNGGSDTATFYDSPGDDTFIATPSSSYMAGSSYWNQVYGFGVVLASDSGQGNDRAYLYGSAGNDTFVGTPTSSYLSGSGFWEQVYGFHVVLAVGQGGTDVAQLYDSEFSQRNDTFFGSPSTSYLEGSSPSPGSSFWNQVFGFAQVYAVVNPAGNAVATLYDSPGNGQFLGQGAVGWLGGSGYLNWTSGFKSVTAVNTAALTSGAFDMADLYTLDYLFAEVGLWLTRQH